MIKKFKNFVNENVENKGKGVGGDTDLFPKAAKKQVVNRSIQTMDYLRIGKYIKTKDIDGFIDSVQGNTIYIADRVSGEINKYDIGKVTKSLIKGEENKSIPVKGFEGTPIWAAKQRIYEKKIETDQDEIEDKDDEDDENVDLDEVKESYYEEEDDEDYVINSQIREPDREHGKEGEEIEVETLENEEEKDIEETMYDEGDEEELDDEIPQPDTSNEIDRNIFKFGTEDNPLGINKGEVTSRNESWLKYWEKFNTKQYELSDNIEEDFDDYEETEEEEDQDKNIRGTEDNPLPDKKKFKMENY